MSELLPISIIDEAIQSGTLRAALLAETETLTEMGSYTQHLVLLYGAIREYLAEHSDSAGKVKIRLMNDLKDNLALPRGIWCCAIFYELEALYRRPASGALGLDLDVLHDWLSLAIKHQQPMLEKTQDIIFGIDDTSGLFSQLKQLNNNYMLLGCKPFYNFET
tara:strand:- start:42379 stop:42867 length:489 start_codon:yes stop_codon:yes gene_type:complete